MVQIYSNKLNYQCIAWRGFISLLSARGYDEVPENYVAMIEMLLRRLWLYQEIDY